MFTDHLATRSSHCRSRRTAANTSPFVIGLGTTSQDPELLYMFTQLIKFEPFTVGGQIRQRADLFGDGGSLLDEQGNLGCHRLLCRGGAFPRTYGLRCGPTLALDIIEHRQRGRGAPVQIVAGVVRVQGP